MRNHEKSGIFCADVGGNYTKIKTKSTRKTISSHKGIISHNFNMKRDFSDNDFLVELDGRRYGVAGLIDESRIPLKMFTESKQNLYYDISLLLAIHQWGYDENYVSIVVPVSSATEEEREGLSKRLTKDWKVTVNGTQKIFTIKDVKVFPEGSTAFFINQPQGKSRYIDVGSRTINWCTVVNDQNGVRFINVESGTFYNAGLEAMNLTLNDYEGGMDLAHYTAGNLLSLWDSNDSVYLLGGGAGNKGFVDGIVSYFPKANVMSNPRTATIDGLWEISKEVFYYAKS